MYPPPWRAPAPVTLVVRPSFSKLSGSRMSGFRKALESWFDAQGMGFLTGFNARRTNSTARMGSYFGRSGWLSVLRQPAHHRAAPKCHRPSALWAACPVAVSSTSRGAKVPFAISLLAEQAWWSSTKPARLADCFGNIKGSVCAASLFIEPRRVCRVLHALSFAPQPNCQVKGTLTSPSVLPTPNGRPLPL